MKLFKFAAAGGLAATAMVATAPAQADFLGLLSQWQAAPVQTVTRAGLPDIIFTYLGTGAQAGGAGCANYLGCELAAGTSAFNANASVSINTNTADQYRVTIGNLNLPAGSTYSIQYFVDVDGWFSPDQAFRLGDVFTGLDRTGAVVADVSHTKQIRGVLADPADPTQDPTGPASNWTQLGPAVGTDGTNNFPAFVANVTTNGGSVQAPFCGQCTRFLITDIVTVSGSGVANNITNTFGLAEVPEPATIALLGVGVVGAGLSARRRKAKS